MFSEGVQTHGKISFGQIIVTPKLLPSSSDVLLPSDNLDFVLDLSTDPQKNCALLVQVKSPVVHKEYGGTDFTSSTLQCILVSQSIPGTLFRFTCIL